MERINFINQILEQIQKCDEQFDMCVKFPEENMRSYFLNNGSEVVVGEEKESDTAQKYSITISNNELDRKMFIEYKVSKENGNQIFTMNIFDKSQLSNYPTIKYESGTGNFEKASFKAYESIEMIYKEDLSYENQHNYVAFSYHDHYSRVIAGGKETSEWCHSTDEKDISKYRKSVNSVLDKICADVNNLISTSKSQLRPRKQKGKE